MAMEKSANISFTVNKVYYQNIHRSSIYPILIVRIKALLKILRLRLEKQ